jgi:hypothetical protein
MQDQFSLVSEKVSGIPEENFAINFELLRRPFTNVGLLRQNWIFSDVTTPGGKEAKFFRKFTKGI